MFTKQVLRHIHSCLHSVKRSLSSNIIRVKERNIHFIQKGNGSHHLLLLPGALGSCETDFNYQIDHFDSTNFSLIGWDPIGYGKSRPPDRIFSPDYFEKDAIDAADLMKELGVSKYSLLGWSDGGITALIMASKFSTHIAKVVAFGANAYVTNTDLELYNSLRNVDAWSDKMKQPMIELYGEEYFRNTWSAWIDGISQYHSNQDGNICIHHLKDILAPTLILHGDKDPVVPEEHPLFLKSMIPHSILYTFPQGKHNLHKRYHFVFNSIVANFLLE